MVFVTSDPTLPRTFFQPLTRQRLRLAIDTGGTFTDCLALDPADGHRRLKILSSSALRTRVVRTDGGRKLEVEPFGSFTGAPLAGLEVALPGGATVRIETADPAEGWILGAAPIELEPGDLLEIRSDEPAPVFAARLMTGTPIGDPLPALDLRVATTRGTNALLERAGVPVALFLTEGFADLPRIGDQTRPDLFARRIVRPPPLHAAVVEVPGRLGADGEEIRPLDLAAVESRARQVRERGIDTAAIALLHSYRNPAHEEAVEAVLRDLGFLHISRSSLLSPQLKILPRLETAVANAYLHAAVGDFLDSVAAAIPPERTRVMTSGGGLVRPYRFSPRDSLLSGPAGGVVGAAAAGARAGVERVISFDMGGTSTDVARVADEPEYRWTTRVGDARIVAPALAIDTVAAGGGSICRDTPDGLRVGPESAGADPGPACYGAGGPLTVTDANLLLGRIPAEMFGVPVFPEAARARAEEVRAAVRDRTGHDPGLEPLLAGFLRLADETMAEAVRGVTLRRGHDPAEHALVAFGGAGPQHACGVARALGIGEVLVPEDAGLLSAAGLEAARVERVAERQLLSAVDAVESDRRRILDELQREAARRLREEEGIADGEMEVRRRIASLRFLGQEATVEVEVADGIPLIDAFRARYRALYGHLPEDRPIEVESLRVIVARSREPIATAAIGAPRTPHPADRRRIWFDGWQDAAVHDRSSLVSGDAVAGPALIREAHSATAIPPRWEMAVDDAGTLRISTTEAGAAREDALPEAVRQDLFVHRLGAIVSEMGDRLERTALSVNVRERRDFSCALLDAEGTLLVNAPHIPVHLGALGECVRRVREAVEMAPGDTIVTNNPGYGGSHLPDITLITPVHDTLGRLAGFVANRAHHAEIGGTRPGSMPAAARTLAEEGVVIAPRHLVRGGEPRWEEMEALLTGGAHPSRSPGENLADLRAQTAANHRGAELFREILEAYGPAEASARMARLIDHAAGRGRDALTRLGEGEYSAIEHLDDGSALAVRITVSGGSAVFDFAGSSGVHPGNRNATPAIVRSAVLYVLRVMVDEPLPLNEGLLRGVELRIPRGILNPDFPDDPTIAPAVVGGNVETSQRLTDALLRALGVMAGSQGTMNNLLFGSNTFGYYETIAGGGGAGPGFHGESGVQVHMTNTRATDAEVLELRYPVRLHRVGLRTGSGGAGRWRGGEGVIREMEFLAPVTLSILAEHRVERPYGMAGGEPGAVGRERLVRASGEEVELAGRGDVEVGPGDRLTLETPGGGGWGGTEDT
jgi:5-oxoprolinase (ATP-hydrolysing)